MYNSGIEWTDTTWNPVEGCTMAPGSENGGCLKCYACRSALRRPAAGLAVLRDTGPRWTGKVGIVEKHLQDPMHWRNPRRIFVNSMSDLFHEALPFEEIDRIFSIMAGCKQHTFQILTKRAGRLLAYVLRFKPDGRGWVTPGGLDAELTHCPVDANRWPLPNVWLGVSVEDTKTWHARVPLLKRAPAAKRFVSYEPALANLDITIADIAGLDLVIIGGESGPGARAFNIQWALNMIRLCAQAGVACFVKQLGALPIMDENQWHAIVNATGKARLLSASKAKYCPAGYVALSLGDKKGGSMVEWPEELRVRELPQ